MTPVSVSNDASPPTHAQPVREPQPNVIPGPSPNNSTAPRIGIVELHAVKGNVGVFACSDLHVTDVVLSLKSHQRILQARRDRFSVFQSDRADDCQLIVRIFVELCEQIKMSGFQRPFSRQSWRETAGCFRPAPGQGRFLQ